MKGISDPFIRRPILTVLLMVGIIVFGAIGYVALPVSDLPTVDFPTIQVSAALPGASPETMAATVATPLERQFATIAGVSSMNSTSAQGSTAITIQFDLGRNIDAAAQDVQTAISAVLAQLPPGMPTPPSQRKVNPADMPVLYLVLSSPTQPMAKVDEIAETTVAQRISMSPGVAQVQVYGAQKYAVRARIEPSELARRGLGIDDVAAALRNGNVNQPVGSVYGPDRQLTIRDNGQLLNAAAFRPLIVAYRAGAPVRLQDVAVVSDSVENTKVASSFNGERSITLAVQRQPGTNTIEVVDAVKRLLPGFRLEIPPSVHLDVLYDRTVSIRHSFSDVRFTLLLTIALVVLVIFLFLRNLRATLIPSLSIPTSLLATFAGMYVLKYSLDNLSLMALTLSVGFVVDDAIVMLENIYRRMELGESPMQAALAGAREVGFTIVSMTVSLVAVFIPIAFMGGLVGRLFREFAVTIGMAILVSGFVSLTLTPMLGSRLLKPHGPVHRTGRFFTFLERGIGWIALRYDQTLDLALRHRTLVMLSLPVLIGLTVGLFVIVPKGFIPTEDQGFILGTTEGAQGVSFEDMLARQNRIADILRRDSNVEALSSTVGAGGRNATGNSGSLFIRLKPSSARRLSADQIISELRPKLNVVPGIRTYLQVPETIRIGGQISKGQYQLTLQGTNTASLYPAADKFLQRLKTLPEIRDVNSDMQAGTPRVTVDIDRARASALGLAIEQVQATLGNAFGRQQVSTIYTATNDYQVILEIRPDLQKDPNVLATVYLHTASGTLVPLSAVARFTSSVGPVLVNHLGQVPSVTVSFNPAPGKSLGDITTRVRTVAGEVLPSGITVSFQGSAQAFQSSAGGMPLLLLVAVLVIYLVLGILYESFIHPLTILSGLPAAGLGALLALWATGQELNVYAVVGLVMLIGIVKKNAIMLVDFAVEGERTGAYARPEDAIRHACRVRFRPILMTTAAALAGTLPIALTPGARQPLGIAVVGGLLISQILTLYLTPVVYLVFDAWRVRPTVTETMPAVLG